MCHNWGWLVWRSGLAHVELQVEVLKRQKGETYTVRSPQNHLEPFGIAVDWSWWHVFKLQLLWGMQTICESGEGGRSLFLLENWTQQSTGLCLIFQTAVVVKWCHCALYYHKTDHDCIASFKSCIKVCVSAIWLECYFQGDFYAEILFRLSIGDSARDHEQALVVFRVTCRVKEGASS